MEIVTLFLFVCILVGCVVADISILYALLLGYVLFAAYAFRKGFSLKEVLSMSYQGIKTVRNVLITFILIGIITALWRAGGTIPTIVCYSMGIMRLEVFVVVTFLLNCLVSFLIGTAFGTAATMGTICMTIAHTLNLNPVLVGGAILSGVYFGDRCSPVSTSALAVAEITKTDLYKNIAHMLKTAVVPFVLTCLIYLVYGFMVPTTNAPIFDAYHVFASVFHMNVFTLIPAILILVLALFRVPVKTTMIVSSIASAVICMVCQKLSISEIVKCSIFGFTTSNGDLAPMINGGGIVSLLRVMAIVCISSCYSGIFQKTGLLHGIKQLIDHAGRKVPAFVVVLMTSIVSSMIACNQMLTIMLTEQLCNQVEEDKEKLALYIEDSAVVVAPLVPWSIAGSVPLATVGAPILSMAASFFLILLPICSMIGVYIKRKRL